jgi:hypothetical protein
MLSLNHRMVRCVTPVGDYRLCYTVSMDQDRLLQISRRSVLDDHQECIDSCLVLAPALSAMKVQYTEDSSFAKDSRPDRRR